MECLKSGLDIFLKRNIQTSVVKSHTIIYLAIAPADNPAPLEFNCLGHGDYYIDSNSVPQPASTYLLSQRARDNVPLYLPE